jgi:hypothetical protein
MTGRGTTTIAALMAFEAVTLAVISPLHLSHVLSGVPKPFNPTAAGAAEAIIGIALTAGALALIRETRHARDTALRRYVSTSSARVRRRGIRRSRRSRSSAAGASPSEAKPPRWIRREPRPPSRYRYAHSG